MSNTAYGQSLSGGFVAPSYITAADTLSIANNNKTFLDAAADTIEYIPKFIGASIISGASQLYNIVPSIGNAFGGDFDLVDTGDVISSLSSDLGRFYEENQSGVDLAGFLVSSLLPGTAGVKLLNAGQKSLTTAMEAGKFGTSLGKALGLVALPNKQKKLAAAVDMAVNNKAATSLLSRNYLRAAGAGLHQGALEALAFETAIAATMFNSPILENQDFGDFVTNVAFGAGAYGLVSGAIDAVKLKKAFNTKLDAEAIEARPYTFIDETHSATSRASDKIIIDNANITNTPPIPDNIDPSKAERFRQALVKKDRILNDRIREQFGTLSAGDQEVASIMHNKMKGMSNQAMQYTMLGLEEVSRVGIKSPKAAKIGALTDKVTKGKATIDEAMELAQSNLSVKYMRTWGDRAGEVLEEMPVVTNIADTLKKGQKIKVTDSKVVIEGGKKEWRFGLAGSKKATEWDIVKADVLEANARYQWAHSVKLEYSLDKPIKVGANDIPLLERVARDLGDNWQDKVQITGLNLEEDVGSSLMDFISDRKLKLANDLLENLGPENIARNQEEIAAIVNINPRVLSGEIKTSSVSNYHPDDMFYLQANAEAYTKELKAKGLLSQNAPTVDITKVPQAVRLTYDTTDFAKINTFEIDQIAVIKEQQKLYQQGTDTAAATVLGNEVYSRLPDINSGTVYQGAKPSGAGPGLVTSANGDYGTLASTVEYIGRVTNDAIAAAKDVARDVLEPAFIKLGQNPEAAIEWSVLNQKVRSFGGTQFGLTEAGLEPIELIRWREAAAKASKAGDEVPARPELPAGVPDVIPINNADTRTAIQAHMSVNANRTNKLATLRTAQGTEYSRPIDTFYPIPVDPREFPYFQIVIDESITSGNQHMTLYAKTADELQAQVAKVQTNPQLTVLSKADSERYFESQGIYDYEKTLNDNYMDVAKQRLGVSAPFLPATDPDKIVREAMKWHMDRESGVIREAISAKYEVQFEELMRLGDQFTDAQTSRFGRGDAFRDLEAVVNNPFADYIKTALGLTKSTDYPWWTNTNRLADQAFTKFHNKVADLFAKSKSPNDLGKINAAMEKAGYKGAAYDEQMEIFANVRADRGALSSVVRKANSLLATVVLRWDAINAANNAISANVLLGTEAASVIRAIERGDSAVAGKLAELTKSVVPGTDKAILTPQKLIANSMKKFIRGSPEELKFYKDNGFMTSISKQYIDSLDALTFNPNVDTIHSWDARLNKLYNKIKSSGDIGEKWTGNTLAEEFNRFVAADVMKQLTDLAVDAGVMTAKEQLPYINTFVNRTQGNYLASQRPTLFSGPIGQAIGLFQTYQFNLLQQMFRHVGEGRGKDVMTLLGLQGTIHGMNGLPAFNAVNTHLIGNASGNQEHKDLYTATYGIAGKYAGDWLMYGAASNFLLHPDLKFNLYTRGDINPRHVTIIPTDPASVPFVQAFSKVVGNIINTADQLAGGADVSTTILKGLEHNGISRPLSGLAVTLQGLNNPTAASYSTTKQGNVIAANDFMHLANLGRIAGAKPLDEAIAVDAVFRYKAYAAKEADKRNQLGQVIKSTMQAGNVPSTEQMEEFAAKYLEAGGRLEEFNKFYLRLYRDANLSQANKLQQDLKSPFSQQMQQLMGGQLLGDFTTGVN